ncbi:hypothetical protein, partial [Streptomyces smyrnaeus]
ALNYAALIASDAGMPHLAAELCWRQHKVFAEAGNLPQDIAVMSLMPLINISRLLTREGDGEAAYDVLVQLYRAARQRGTATICGHNIDLSTLIRTTEDHRKICQELWVCILVDGARALARSGQWTKAADAMAEHRGIGNRLLDGRQIKIMSLVERDLREQARDMIDSTCSAEPWENAVAAVLRLCCHPEPASQPEQAQALRLTVELIDPGDSATAAFQTRLALTALDLTGDQTGPATDRLRSAVIDIAASDAYAARDILAHPPACTHITNEQEDNLRTVVAKSGLGAGGLPTAQMNALVSAVTEAEAALGGLLPLTRKD